LPHWHALCDDETYKTYKSARFKKTAREKVMSFNKSIPCTLLGLAMAGAFADAAAQVDITSSNGVVIGGAVGGAGGKFVPWGGTVTLVDADAFLMSNGHCAFNVAYPMTNTGTAPSGLFKNWIVANGATVAINSNLSLEPASSRMVYTQPYLPQGSYEFALKLDVENSIAETDETNNIFTVKVNFNGLCGAAPAPTPTPTPTPTGKPDLAPGSGIAVGGKTAAWGGVIALKTADTFLQSNGKCAVNISYQMANVGTAGAGPAFTNRLLSGTTLVSQQSGLSLDAGKTKIVNTQGYIVPGLNQLRLVIDAENAIAESNESNNVAQVSVTLDSNCGAPKVLRK
jgi:hypothetical protein